EREYAARAGWTHKYAFGHESSKLGEYAWFNGNAAGHDPPVGAKKPNAWGLYDVHGYLWEWTAGDLPASAGGAEHAVVRGGSWKDKAELLESASRQVVSASLRDDAIGLRCVLTVVGVNAGGASEFQPTAQHKSGPAGA